MTESPVLYEKSDHVVTITMNRPEKKNAINMAMRERLLEAWGTFRDDDDAWVVILTGTGDAFSSGRGPQRKPGQGRRKDEGTLAQRARGQGTERL